MVHNDVRTTTISIRWSTISGVVASFRQMFDRCQAGQCLAGSIEEDFMRIVRAEYGPLLLSWLQIRRTCRSFFLPNVYTLDSHVCLFRLVYPFCQTSQNLVKYSAQTCPTFGNITSRLQFDKMWQLCVNTFVEKTMEC